MGFRGTESNAKTVLCTRFTSPEGCRFGDRCNFAHGTVEIRSRPEGVVARGRPGTHEEGNGFAKPTAGTSQYPSRGALWPGGESLKEVLGGQGQYANTNGNGSHWPPTNGNSAWPSAAGNAVAHNGLLGNGAARRRAQLARLVTAHRAGRVPILLQQPNGREPMGAAPGAGLPDGNTLVLGLHSCELVVWSGIGGRYRCCGATAPVCLQASLVHWRRRHAVALSIIEHKVVESDTCAEVHIWPLMWLRSSDTDAN